MSFASQSFCLILIKGRPKAGSYTEFAAVFTNVFLGMQLPLSSYLQVCFCILNDVVMSISLMYEKPEAGASAPTDACDRKAEIKPAQI